MLLWLAFALSLAAAAAARAQEPDARDAAPLDDFAKQSLDADSQNSIWRSFPYDATAWRQDRPAQQRFGNTTGECGAFGDEEPCGRISLGKMTHSWADKPDPASASYATSTAANDSLKSTAAPTGNQSVEWGHLLWDSTKFLLFLHAYRLANEPETRAGLSGPFFKDYANAVSSINGWNDGDPFETNYINHPMEGGVAGFLWVAHYPRYRQAEFGKSSRYWKSRLRAMAYAAAFSLQFEIGPISEASIGNVQDAAPGKAGVVDWVITPTVGFAWMVGEDMMDQYVIKKMEARTDSHIRRILLRSALNPTRSFANMMQGKPPWNRDTRPGVREF